MSEEKEAALIKNAQAPRNKQHEVEEATNILSATRKCFRNIVLDYVLQVGPSRGGPTWTLHLASRGEAALETERASSYWRIPHGCIASLRTSFNHEFYWWRCRGLPRQWAASATSHHVLLHASALLTVCSELKHCKCRPSPRVLLSSSVWEAHPRGPVGADADRENSMQTSSRDLILFLQHIKRAVFPSTYQQSADSF